MGTYIGVGDAITGYAEDFSYRGVVRLLEAYESFYKRLGPLNNYNMSPTECLQIFIDMSSKEYLDSLDKFSYDATDIFLNILVEAIRSNSFLRFEPA